MVNKNKNKSLSFDDIIEELESYDDGCDKPSSIISSGF